MCEVTAAGAVRSAPSRRVPITRQQRTRARPIAGRVALAAVTNPPPIDGPELDPQASSRLHPVLLSAQLLLDRGLQGGGIRSATRSCFSAAAPPPPPPPPPRRVRRRRAASAAAAPFTFSHVGKTRGEVKRAPGIAPGRDCRQAGSWLSRTA